MKIYLDEDSTDKHVVRLLKSAGHEVTLPADNNMIGKKDTAHFLWAIRHDQVLFTQNFEDFDLLNELVITTGGHHPGVLAVRKDNDRKRDMRPRQIVHAINNLLAAGAPLADNLWVLNHWK